MPTFYLLLLVLGVDVYFYLMCLMVIGLLMYKSKGIPKELPKDRLSCFMPVGFCFEFLCS